MTDGMWGVREGQELRVTPRYQEPPTGFRELCAFAFLLVGMYTTGCGDGIMFLYHFRWTKQVAHPVGM